MKRLQLVLLVTALFAVIGFYSCKKEEADTSLITEIKMPDVPTGGFCVKPGDTLKINLEILPSSAAGSKVIWTSSKESVATVDSTGLVTAHAIGEVYITAKAEKGSAQAFCGLLVVADPTVITSIQILDVPEEGFTVVPGDSLKLNVQILPSTAARSELFWMSSNTNVATVDTTGAVYACGADGETTVTVYAKKGEASSSCAVKVVYPTKYDVAMVYEKLAELYASLCQIYGDPNYYTSQEVGTDEATWGALADDRCKAMDFADELMPTPANSGSNILWEKGFDAINTANEIIAYAEESVPKELKAEARFFRGFYYFQLVQTFGGVPLNLGRGVLEPAPFPVPGERVTVPEVYEVIFKDLEEAVPNLRESNRDGSTLRMWAAVKNSALLVLAKAYLTYAWWLENPNNIDTYPYCDRDKGQAINYYQKAYSMSEAAINDLGDYGLCEAYIDIHSVSLFSSIHGNKEVLLYADHSTYPSASGNMAGSLMNWDFNTLKINRVKLVQSELDVFPQYLGYPNTYIAPTQEAFGDRFDNKDYDSRYDGTFTTTYLNSSGKAVTGANGKEIPDGEVALKFLTRNDVGEVTYPEKQSDKDGANVGGGTIKDGGDGAYVFRYPVFGNPSFSRRVFPALWKLGSDGSVNTRPFYILKFSEFYLIAAEAAVKMGKNDEAKKMINVIRGRAGIWRKEAGVHKEVKPSDPLFADRSAEMQAATPNDIRVSDILDERLREYFGEGYRWLDLVRTQMWNDRAGRYTIAGTEWGDVKSETYRRDISSYMYLRPIPQSQINKLPVGKREGYQNPYYQ